MNIQKFRFQKKIKQFQEKQKQEEESRLLSIVNLFKDEFETTQDPVEALFAVTDEFGLDYEQAYQTVFPYLSPDEQLLMKKYRKNSRRY